MLPVQAAHRVLKVSPVHPERLVQVEPPVQQARVEQAVLKESQGLRELREPPEPPVQPGHPERVGRKVLQVQAGRRVRVVLPERQAQVVVVVHPV